MTPLERDLKEYYTPGKDQNRHSERDIGLMKQVSSIVRERAID